MGKQDLSHDAPDADLVWKMIEHVRVSMLVTRDGDQLDGRPFSAFPDQDAGKIFYMTAADGDAVSQINADGRVFLTIGDKGRNDYATIEGDAIVRDDRAKIRELWNPWAEAYFDGPDDPNIRIIEVTPSHARYWDAPNGPAATIAMLAGLVAGKTPDVGKQGETRL